MSEPEVAIIGAGFAGCATARALADRGVPSILLEREPALGRHASGRGAGLGRQLAEDDATTALTVRGAALLRERYPDAWLPTGGILGFDSEAHVETYVARARRFALPCERIDRASVLARWPALGGLPITAALHVPSDGTIDVAALLGHLARDLAVETDVAVTAVHPGVIETSRGVRRARIVVDASGAWAGSLVDEPPLTVLKRHLYVLEATPPDAATPYFWHLGSDELYVRRAAEGILASACDREPTSPRAQEPSPDADERLRARLGRAAPGWPVAIRRRWACQRAFAPDLRMRLGRDPQRPYLVWAAALGGHGATACAAVGATVAAAVIEALEAAR